MNSNSSIEALVASQLTRRLAEAGLAEVPAAALDAAHKVLENSELSVSEQAMLEERALDASIDPVAVLLGQRIERALHAGIVAAGLEAEANEPTEVLVLRTAAGESFANVLGALRKHVSARMKGEDTRVLLVAAKQAYSKVKQLMPSGRVKGMPTIEFHEDGTVKADTTAAIEVVAADFDAEEIQSRASARVEEIRKDSVDADSLAAAWVAADDSPDSVPATHNPVPLAERRTVPAPAPTNGEDPMLGQLFHSKYRILRCLGKGGFGSVYEATDERGAGNRVAIKVLSGKAAESAGQQQSFKDEARRVTRLSHPNIVDWKVFDETEDGIPYFVMELVSGEEFEETLRRDRKVEPERAATLLLQVLDALRAAHNLAKGQSILHLDLKPGNLFRLPPRANREEQLKVIDFGIGQFIGDEKVSGDTVVPAEGLKPEDLEGPSTLSFARPAGMQESKTGVTRSQGCTPEYASPEQCAHVMYKKDIVALDGRSDLYSLGVIAFEMLTGQLPFKSKTRLDVLRMHLEEAPPQVGSMGVRIPKQLAKFVDRCLEKDRDKRWANTNEAYQYLHSIVHPPVWKTVAKVTVPIVLVSLAVGTWLWATRDVVVPTATFVSADGVNLDDSPLHLGPKRTSVNLSVAGSELSSDTSETWRVMNLADGTESTNWKASWAEDGSVVVQAISTPVGRITEGVELLLGEDTLRSRKADLVWLGESAWSASEVNLGGVDVNSLSDKGINAKGLALELWIDGEARKESLEIALQIGEHSSPDPVKGGGTEERERYKFELADFRLDTGGRRNASLVVRDRAGNEWSREFDLNVVVDSPRLIGEAALVDAAGQPDADGKSPESNKILGSYSVSKRTKPVLTAELVRPADIGWQVVVEGSSEPEMRGTLEGKRKFDIDLAGLADLNGGKPFRGEILLSFDEDNYVFHEPGSGRNKTAASIPFFFEDKLPTFTLQLRGEDGSTRDFETVGGEELLFTKLANAELLVTRTEAVPMRVDVEYWPIGQPDKKKSESTGAEFHKLQTQQAALPIALSADGEWNLHVRSYRFDTTAKATSERADLEERFLLILDRDSIATSLVGLQNGQVLSALDSAPNELDLQFEGLSASAREAAVDLQWQLIRPAVGNQPQHAGSIAGHDPSGGNARIDLGGALRDSSKLADGSYRLEVSGTDRAGNAIRNASVAFVVAAKGPAVSLDQPTGIGKWHRDEANGRWNVRVRAEDANGLDDITCELIAGDWSTPISLERPEDGSTATRWALGGSLRIPYTLSESQVKLRFKATDLHGMESDWTSDAFELPVITRPQPDRISVALAGRDIESMRLVRGNAEFQYLFGGRGDAVENPDFRDAKLGQFNSDPRKSRSRSWQIPFEAGTIEDYYLDEREVSNGQFLAFVQEPLGYMSAEHWPPGTAPSAADRDMQLAALAKLPNDMPVTRVTWAEAYAYAHWVGKRLPSWLEWEYAVRGGAEYRPHSAYDRDTKLSRTAAKSGATPALRGEGDWTPGNRFADLCGNVGEWTCTGGPSNEGQRLYAHQWAEQYPELLLAEDLNSRDHWVVGGHFAHSRIDFTVADRRPSNFRHATIGFRCAISLSTLQDKLGLDIPHEATFAEQQ